MISKKDAYDLIEERGFVVKEAEDGKSVAIYSDAVNQQFQTPEMNELGAKPYAESTVLDENDASYWLVGAINYGIAKYNYEIQKLAGSMIHDNPGQEPNLRWITYTLLKDGELLGDVARELEQYMDRDYVKYDEKSSDVEIPDYDGYQDLDEILID